jgi:AraC-like DNA-binding protein/quercetin dioxygenase-like cupin family protein
MLRRTGLAVNRQTANHQRKSAMPRAPALQPTPIGDTDAFTPTPGRPVRVRARNLPADAHLQPHRHGWGQLAYCDRGMTQVSAHAPEEVTYIVPPSRAVWIPPGALHAVTVIEAAQLRTLYVCASAVPKGWTTSRVLKVSPLLRELIAALDASPSADRERALTALILDEITHADTQALGVPLPHPQTGDKRLRALCEAVLRAPGERATLAEWAANIGASERTVARLFRDELGTSYQQWRQQVVLAHALPMLARGYAVSQVAAASGYASDSAFTAMFKAAMGQPPRHFQD